MEIKRFLNSLFIYMKYGDNNYTFAKYYYNTYFNRWPTILFNIPDYIPLDRIEPIVNEIGNKMCSDVSDSSHLFKYFSYVPNREKITKILIESCPKTTDRLFANIYQHNFTMGEKRYSIIIITSLKNVIAVYLLNGYCNNIDYVDIHFKIT